MAYSRLVLALATGAAFVGAAVCAQAADYPTKPITVIVGFAAGGGTDAFVRAVAEPASTKLGQPILVQNKPGAGGGVAAMAVKAAAPDGYTLMATGSLTFTFEPQVMKVQYGLDDFEHIAIVSQFQEGLFAHPSRPYSTMKELIALAKKEKRDIKYASLYQLDRHIFSYVGKKEGVKIIPVPTQGGSGTVQAALANQVDFGVSGGSFGPHVESGALKLIGAMTAERLGKFPDVPSMEDNGWDVGSENYVIISAPKGTPKDVVAKIAEALKTGASTPTVEKIVKSRYMRDVYIGPDKIDASLARQSKMYADMMAAIK